MTSSAKPRHRIVVSQGDIAGVGFHSLLTIVENPGEFLLAAQYRRLQDLIVIGDISDNYSRRIRASFEVIEFSEDFDDTELNSALANKTKKPLFFNLKTQDSVKLGNGTTETASRSYRAFLVSGRVWHTIESASLLTLPVSKELIRRSGVDFQGHTEVLHTFSDSLPYMCMYHPQLSVVLLTTHIPLKNVATDILVTNFNALAASLKQFQGVFNQKKQIAYLGLNPHAGEGGEIGIEDNVLKKKMKEISKDNLSLDGPYSADSFFNPLNLKKYNLVVANYHDQGLIPFKTLFGLEGINITLNLNKLRVSPDHGPGYDIAGSKKVDHTSVSNSLQFAIKWGSKWRR